LCIASALVILQKVLGSLLGFSCSKHTRAFAGVLAAIGLIAFARPASGQG